MALSRPAQPPADERRTTRRAVRQQRLRRWLAGSHALLGIALAVLLAGLVSLLALRLNLTLDLPNSVEPLSPGTQAQVAALEQPLTITCIVERRHPGFVPVYRLLRELARTARAARRDLTVAFIDPHRDITRAAQLMRASGAEANTLIFEREGRWTVVRLDELFDYPADPAAPRRPIAFRGEATIATALARLSQTHAPTVYALAGHGERDFANYDPTTGYSTLAREIRRQGYDLRALTLAAADSIPGDCDVLIAAGPRNGLSAAEVDRVDAYLTRGGRLLLLADRDRRSGLEPILDRFGLTLTDLTAVGPQTLSGYEVVVDHFASHPVSRGMSNTAAVFVSPQIIGTRQPDAATRTDQVLVTVVAEAPREAWGETAPEAFPRHYDPGVDCKGELALLVAVERGGSAAADVAFRPMRLVVAGDSHFGSNGLLEHGRNGNRDLLLNALDWLADGPATAAAPPSRDALRLGLSRRQWTIFTVGTAAVIPAAWLLLGALVLGLRYLRTAPRPGR